MRAALRLRSYRHWEPELLHDEGVVLGVRHAGQEEAETLDPEDAQAAFNRYADDFGAVLQLVGSGVDADRFGVAGTGSIVPAGYRPGTAFIMMCMDATVPSLADVADTIK